MNSGITITTQSPVETREFGQFLGEIVQQGTVITLNGDLGTGKTTFVQGLAKGLGVSEKYYITSPTYTLIHEYPGRIQLFHVDLYRLGDTEDLDDLGLDDIFCGQGVAAIEWPEKLPENYLTSYISLTLENIDEKTRKIRIFSYGLERVDLIGEIEKKRKEKKWH